MPVQTLVCCCDACARSLPGVAELLRARLRAWLDDPYAAVEPIDSAAIVQHRHRIQRQLLQRIRQSVPGVTLNVRVSPDERFRGGKCSLPLDCIARLADEVTYTFFGAPADKMRIPEQWPLPAYCGFILHEPDSGSEDDIRRRLSAAQADGFGFYSFSMAARPHWRWLRQALRGSRT